MSQQSGVEGRTTYWFVYCWVEVVVGGVGVEVWRLRELPSFYCTVVGPHPKIYTVVPVTTINNTTISASKGNNHPF